jgi:transcription-repair coupling factor (superfamily II helicase)
LYTSLLAEAVQKLRKDQGTPIPSLPATFKLQLNTANVELPVPAGIPAEYIPDKKTRLGLYRRMAEMRKFSDLETLVEEFKDRFGTPPETVSNLFLQLKVTLMAGKAGLASITVENGQFVLRFPEGEMPEKLPDFKPQVRVGKTALWISLGDNWPEVLLDTLDKLKNATPQIAAEAA